MSQASRSAHSGRTSPTPPRSAGGTAMASLRSRVASLSRGAAAVAGESPVSASSLASSFEMLTGGGFGLGTAPAMSRFGGSVGASDGQAAESQAARGLLEEEEVVDFQSQGDDDLSRRLEGLGFGPIVSPPMASVIGVQHRTTQRCEVKGDSVLAR